MPEPRINDLEPQNEGIRDGIAVPSHVLEAVAGSGRKCQICQNTWTIANPRKRFCCRACKEAHAKANPRRGDPAPAWLTESEIKSLMAVITSPRDRAIFSVAYHRGLRASEVGMLQMRDYTPASINERTGRLYCRRLKDSDSKIYSLTRPENKELLRWLKIRGGAAGGSIFQSSRRKGISRKRLDTLMKRYGKLAGIPPELRHFHTLKHSCGVHLLLQGLGVDQVKDWLGHRSVVNTMIYLRVANIRLDAAAEKLANW